MSFFKNLTFVAVHPIKLILKYKLLTNNERSGILNAQVHIELESTRIVWEESVQIEFSKRTQNF